MSEPFVFRPFDPRRAVVIYRNNLPLWRQDGASYFVTFRLGDSIPAHVHKGWMKDRETWLVAQGVHGPLADPKWRNIYESIPNHERDQFERMQRRRGERELDNGHGSCLLKLPENHSVVSDALLFFHGERCWTGDFVVMPNHVHALVTPTEEHSLESLLKSVKQHSSLNINRRSGQSGSIWQKASHDRIVRDRTELRRIREYIAKNPAKARLAANSYAHHREPELDAFC